MKGYNVLNKTGEKNIALEGALSLTIATVIVKVLGAIYKIPISYVLGEEGMGYFNSAYTVYSFFFLLCTAGVPKAIMILCAEANDKKESCEIVVKTSLRFFLIVGVVICLSFSLLSKFLSEIIGSPNAYLSMIFISPSILFCAVSGVLRGYFSAKVKFSHVAISQIVEGAGKLIFGLSLALISKKTNCTLNIISAFAILGATLGSLASFVYLLIVSKSKSYNNKKKQNADFDEKAIVISRMIKISLPIAIGSMIMSVTNIIDLGIVINRLLALGYSAAKATALYGNYTTLATPMFNTIISLFTPLTVAFMPSLIKKRNDMESLYNIILDELKTSFYIFVPLTIGIYIYSEEILLLLFDDRSVFVGSELLKYLLISILFIIPLTIINSAMEALGKAKVTMISMLAGGITKVIVAYFLIGNRRVGILGAPISTIAFYGMALIVSLIFSYKKAKIVVPIARSLFIPLVNSFVAIYTFYPIYVYTSAKINRMLSLILAIAFSVALYVTISSLQKNKPILSIMKYRMHK